ncbi:GerAB/ArcD/ProY family transporter [Paenibacillus sacheonensis]|uniref:GerAB/ArcD/ProY family transporter n=1 Tax=Paenibacillus sacheonensis TaxID=742054 RepID=A0A7X4YK12_9BACL|nr:GerAB/ArcD/ProY family transporter [Paenibacillus sacheonensis]MBM7563951.1 spore germination protein (amino acid permease) [Paenibacillus sacheonensis]NBC67707.1 GerAB/ArcD/ProY family transporter [Paenibacillus sacheonensis]
MMKEGTISGRQLITLIIMAQLGTEVISLPHAAALHAGRDSWLAVLLSGLAAQIGIMLMWWLGSRYPTRNIYAYAPLIVGKPIGAVINFAYGGYYAISGLLVTLMYADILNRWLFTFTPKWPILLMLLIVIGYAATSSLRNLALISQSFLIVPIVGFVFIVFSGNQGLEIRNLLPLLTEGWNPVMKGIYIAFSAYAGYDLLLYAYPYIETRSKKKLLLAMTIANACTIVLYVAVTLVCSMTLGLKQLAVIPEPIVFLLKNYRFKILQGVDILFIISCACIVSATVFVYFFLAARAFQHLRGRGLGKQHVWVWAIVCGCFIASFFISKRDSIMQYGSMQDKLSILMIVGLPVILLMISGLRGTGRSRA